MATTTASPTQQFVPIKEIRNGVIVMKDGSYRGVVLCSSINFGLKSADEQRAVIQGFQSFLNTLDFSIQIVVNSRRMDLRPYLALLATKEIDQKTELMRIQLREYVEFIRSFADQANIMTKSFYIVVPYTPKMAAAKAVGLGIFSKTPSQQTANASFEEHRVQLEQRLTLVAGGLAGTGVRAVPLGTEEVIELLYRSFNPGELENPIRLEQ